MVWSFITSLTFKWWLGYALLLIASLYFVMWIFRPLIASYVQQPALQFSHSFYDPQTRRRHPFPSLFDDASTSISVIVPAYNEENRISEMLDEAIPYLLKREELINNGARSPKSKKRGGSSRRSSLNKGEHKSSDLFSWEVIVVDDGSEDKTCEVVNKYVERLGTDRMRLLVLPANQGKGGAVQQGMLVARGRHVLMCDADGATQFSDIAKLMGSITQISRNGLGMAVGSRAHLEENAVATRSFVRNVLMWGFHFLVSCLCVKNIRDTQCGFKLFTREAARFVFANQHLRRWSFDVELLFLAQQVGIPTAEVGVQWSEIPGSKVDLLHASLQMGRDLVIIRIAYLFRLWRYRVKLWGAGGRHAPVVLLLPGQVNQ